MERAANLLVKVVIVRLEGSLGGRLVFDFRVHLNNEGDQMFNIVTGQSSRNRAAMDAILMANAPA